MSACHCRRICRLSGWQARQRRRPAGPQAVASPPAPVALAPAAPAVSSPLAPSGQPGCQAYGEPLCGRAEPLGATMDAETVCRVRWRWEDEAGHGPFWRPGQARAIYPPPTVWAPVFGRLVHCRACCAALQGLASVIGRALAQARGHGPPKRRCMCIASTAPPGWPPHQPGWHAAASSLGLPTPAYFAQ